MVNSENGFGLIEVLVACAIFTIGLLGMVDTQLIALRFNQQINAQASDYINKNNQSEESLATGGKT